MNPDMLYEVSQSNYALTELFKFLGLMAVGIAFCAWFARRYECPSKKYDFNVFDVNKMKEDLEWTKKQLKLLLTNTKRLSGEMKYWVTSKLAA